MKKLLIFMFAVATLLSAQTLADGVDLAYDKPINPESANFEQLA